MLLFQATLLITRNKFPINTVKEYQWVGLPEITALLRQADSNSMMHSATPMCNNVTCILNTDDTEIVYYKWEVEDVCAFAAFFSRYLVADVVFEHCHSWLRCSRTRITAWLC